MSLLLGIAIGAAPFLIYLAHKLYRRYKDALET